MLEWECSNNQAIRQSDNQAIIFCLCHFLRCKKHKAITRLGDDYNCVVWGKDHRLRVWDTLQRCISWCSIFDTHLAADMLYPTQQKLGCSHSVATPHSLCGVIGIACFQHAKNQRVWVDSIVVGVFYEMLNLLFWFCRKRKTSYLCRH